MKVVHGIVDISPFPYTKKITRNLCTDGVPPFPSNRRTLITCKKCLLKLKKYDEWKNKEKLKKKGE